MNGTLGKTLIVRFSSIGDIVLASPLVRVLRRHAPGARIDFLVKSGYADLVRFSPHLSGVIEFPSHGGLKDLLALRRRIADARYDLIVDLHDSIRSRMLCVGAARVVRVRKRKLARFCLVRFHRDVYRYFGGAPPVAERYLETLAPFGIRDDGEGLEFSIPEAAAVQARAVARDAGLREDLPVIGVCPAARHATKIWPPERFGAVAAALAAERGAAVLLFGSADEQERCGEVARTIAARQPYITVLNLAGKLSLAETGAMMDRCMVVLTNDTGLMHVAAARKRKVVAVFGSTVRQFGFFPFGTRSVVVEHPSLNCRPCTHIGRPACPLGHFRCMLEVREQQVLEAARTLLLP
jgi:lipopolysaccharide heptosyltransferase II